MLKSHGENPYPTRFFFISAAEGGSPISPGGVADIADLATPPPGGLSRRYRDIAERFPPHLLAYVISNRGIWPVPAQALWC